MVVDAKEVGQYRIESTVIHRNLDDLMIGLIRQKHKVIKK
jgi:hypothetical protein